MIINKSTGQLLSKKSSWMNSFLTQSVGAMFRKNLDKALIFPLGRPAKGRAAIHMFFVFTPLTVLWVNEAKVVVDKALAQPFRAYSPDYDAKYVIELPPQIFNKVSVGDYLYF
jgi:uncharacterized membrane protein (UPF0127 family)